ncbi:MAG: acetate/propionate family kinase [Methylococcaceae bacterium]|nr:acetate/propionate family kinase [Methylococcaceae bacterium]MDZ4155333.1 acetate/propionate family kinase [Methylococcales bacterium]MDP2393945.1 acetate/propionate family kinase [Methylococcaceae bacterium]MDP3018067.1 acetate/propionate family kinase [Methylococcaceae bacterium]MDP3391822.1 acetate/propionate family kinase [Methylococcaceae bacterium]
MSACLLVINAGSSSIKFTLYGLVENHHLVVELNGQVAGIGDQGQFTASDAAGDSLVVQQLPPHSADKHSQAFEVIYQWLLGYLQGRTLVAVGHRIVHGGQLYAAPVLIDDRVFKHLEALIPLAPLHQPHNLAPIRELQKISPTLPQIACFDTAFHFTQPEVAHRLALPRKFTEAGLRRYGFHGLSYEYIANLLPQLKLAGARVIVAHLGSGASLCALKDGRSVATSMGFSPLDGLVMGTRCGSLDPGVLLYLMDHYQMDARALEKLLYFQSGLLGISGISSDMTSLLASSDPHACEAVESFVYRVTRELGSLAAALGGLDALIFTGGIGEHSVIIRQRICQQAAWLGVGLDDNANQQQEPRFCISKAASTVATWVVQTDENLMIARHTLKLLISK